MHGHGVDELVLEGDGGVVVATSVTVARQSWETSRTLALLTEVTLRRRLLASSKATRATRATSALV